MKKIISFILLLTVTIGIISCSPSGDYANKDKETPNAGQSDQSQDNIEMTAEYDSLPDMDMEGFELRFYNYDNDFMTWAVNELTSDEETGDLVLDEIYRRNRRIEAKYNCKIIENAVINTYDSNIKNTILSGQDVYDIVQLYDEFVVSSYIQGFLYTWDKLPHIDLYSPWWLQDANSVFRFNGRQFAAVGAFSLAMYSRGFILLFNKDMLANLGGENLYNSVREDKWTIDKFAETAKLAIYDLNGDGVMDDDDRYGIATGVKLHFGSLITGAGVKYIEMNEQGVPYFAIPGNNYAFDVMQKIFDVHKSAEIFRKMADDVHDGANRGRDMFANEQALFHGYYMKGIEYCRGLEFDMGILPYPKYSEQQEKHYTLTSGTGVSVIPVTLNTDRFDKVGLLLEALARDSYQKLLPAYKETTLKTKYARDDDSAQMLDIIFNSFTFDLGTSVFPGDTYYAYMENYLKMDDTFASTTEKLANRVEAAIKKLIEAAEADG